MSVEFGNSLFLQTMKVNRFVLKYRFDHFQQAMIYTPFNILKQTKMFFSWWAFVKTNTLSSFFI